MACMKFEVIADCRPTYYTIARWNLRVLVYCVLMQMVVLHFGGMRSYTAINHFLMFCNSMLVRSDFHTVTEAGSYEKISWSNISPNFSTLICISAFNFATSSSRYYLHRKQERGTFFSLWFIYEVGVWAYLFDKEKKDTVIKLLFPTYIEKIRQWVMNIKECRAWIIESCLGGGGDE
jgi:hypothetical protein